MKNTVLLLTLSSITAASAMQPYQVCTRAISNYRDIGQEDERCLEARKQIATPAQNQCKLQSVIVLAAKRVASLDTSNILKIWDTQTGTCIQETEIVIPGHKFSPKRIVLGTPENTVVIEYQNIPDFFDDCRYPTKDQ